MAAVGLKGPGGKPLKRPIVKVRNSALSATGMIIDITAPDGSRVLIDVDTNRDHSGLMIAPRGKFDRSNPAGEDVSVNLGGHSPLGNPKPCELFSAAPSARCTCGAYHVPDGYTWKPTAPKGAP